MVTTLLSVVLASAGLATGDTPDVPYMPFMMYGYGSNGSYGSYGSYASQPGRARWVMPYYMNPGFDHGARAKENEVLEKRFTELKTMLGGYEQKIKALESKLDEQDKISDTQVKVLEIFNKSHAKTMEAVDAKLAESQTRIIEKLTILEKGGGDENARKNIESAIAENVRAMAARIDDRLGRLEEKLFVAKGSATSQENSATAASQRTLEERIALLEALLKSNSAIGDQIKSGLDTIGKNLGQGGARPRDPRGETTGVPTNRGLIVVSLPADARLFLDGHPSAVGANLRTFISPELELGKNYFYTIRAELERNGKTLTESQRVYFQPGREVKVSFDHLEATFANGQGNIQGSAQQRPKN